MNSWREWAMALSSLAVAGAVLQPLIPKNGTGRFFKLILSAGVLCAFLWPLGQLQGGSAPDFSVTDPTPSASLLQEQLREQVETQINAVLTDRANEALAGYRLEIKKAEAGVDIDEDNCISIEQVRVHLDARNSESRSTVLLVLRQQFGTEVVIVNEE